VSEALEIQEIRNEFLREAGFNLTNLRNQIQLMYWSEQHFITQGLLKLLPFGEILSDIRFYSYIDYSLDKLIVRQIKPYFIGDYQELPNMTEPL